MFSSIFFLFAFLFFVPVYFNLPVSFKSIKAKSDSLHLHFWFVSTSLHKNAQGVFFCEMAIKRQQLRKNTPRMVALPLYRYCGPHCLFFSLQRQQKNIIMRAPVCIPDWRRVVMCTEKPRIAVLREGKSQERMHYNNTQKKTVKRKVQISSDQIVACDTECGLSCNFSAKCVNTWNWFWLLAG